MNGTPGHRRAVRGGGGWHGGRLGRRMLREEGGGGAGLRRHKEQSDGAWLSIEVVPQELGGRLATRIPKQTRKETW